MNNLIRLTLRGHDRFFNVDNDIEDIVEEECVDGMVSIITLKNGRQIFVDQSPIEIYKAINNALKGEK